MRGLSALRSLKFQVKRSDNESKRNRMPAIFPADAQSAWLDPAARWRSLLEPDADGLELVAVSSHVNSVKSDDRECAVAIPGPNSA